MLRITRLLSHHSFGVKNSFQRRKNLLVKRVNGGLPAPSRFPSKIWHQIVIKLTSSSSKLSFQQQEIRKQQVR